MPNETQAAVEWALTQTYIDFGGYEHPITKEDTQPLVDKVCEYFRANKIAYETFSYSDLEQYLN